MGDRCYVHCAVQPKDTERFIDIFGGEHQPGHEGYCGLFSDVEDEQDDDGFEERLCECAKAGMVFLGYSTPGDAYPAVRFASNGDGDLHRVECVWDCEAVPVVRINDDGDPSPDEYHYACVHMAVYNQVRAMAFPEKKEDEENMDFGEKLEAVLHRLDNKAIIQEMGFHDPENVSLLLDYILDRRRRELHTVEREDHDGWLSLLDRFALQEVVRVCQKFMNNMVPMKEKPHRVAAAAHVLARSEELLNAERTKELLDRRKRLTGYAPSYWRC